MGGRCGGAPYILHIKYRDVKSRVVYGEVFGLDMHQSFQEQIGKQGNDNDAGPVEPKTGSSHVFYGQSSCAEHNGIGWSGHG